MTSGNGDAISAQGGLVELTPDQRRAVTAEGVDLAVLAGAGSGKTRVLVARAVHLLTRKKDRLPLSSILALTFTEKAAREMKERLATALVTAGLLATRAEVEWAYVTTIHGFCARILRENAVEAVVDPAYAVLDQVQAETILRGAIAEVAERWSRQRPGDIAAITLLGVWDIEAEVLGLFDRLRAAGVSPEKVLVPAADPEVGRLALDAVVSAISDLEPLLPDSPPSSRKKAESVLEFLSRLEGVSGSPLGEVLAVLDDLSGRISLQVSAALKEILKPLREKLVPAAVHAVADELARPSLLALTEFLADADRRYTDRKEESGALDFADLESRTLALLTDHPGVRDSIRDRFRQILVDEYQDVNPVQAGIIERIRGTGNHFAVGDVKQSIYGFRNAEPSLFKRYSDEVGEAACVTLRSNFRSSPGLVDLANHCFSRLFADQPLVTWSDMVAEGEFAKVEGPEVEILLSAGDTAAEGREAEAGSIARRIRDLVDGEEIRLARSGDRQGDPVRYGDIAVLFRAMTDVKTYERALEDNDVPYYVVKGRGFFQAREVVDLIRLLRTVMNPRDEVSLAAVLRSPFAAVSEDGLLALATEARSRDDRNLAGLLLSPDVPGLRERDEVRWRRFAAMHEQLRRLAGRAPIREVLRHALAASGYGTAVWLLPGGRRRAANQQKVLALADSLEEICDLGEFLAVLEDLRVRETKETEAPTGGEAEDVVKLLTVHAAKGLEFPVVIVPDLSRASGGTPPGLLFDEDGLSAKIRPEPSADGLPTTHFRKLRRDLARRERAESLRLLYVAVTRAEERLFLSAREGRGARVAGSWWAALSSVLQVDGEEVVFGAGRRVARVVRAASGEAAKGRRESLLWKNRARLAAAEPLPPHSGDHRGRARELAARADLPRAVPDGSCFQNTVTELLVFAGCPRRHWYRYGLGIPELTARPPADGEERDEEGSGHDELPPREIGILVHEILRVAPSRERLGGVARERLRAILPIEREGTEELLAKAESMVLSFYDHPIGQEVTAARADQVRREVPFFVRWPLAGGSDWGLVIRGKIDLFYPRPDGSFLIVDYKTGRTAPEEYRLQLVAYAKALDALVDAPLSASFVYLAPDRPAEEKPVRLDEAAREEVAGVAARFSEAVAASRVESFPKGPAPDCRTCPYSSFCA